MRDWTEYVTEELSKNRFTEFQDEENVSCRWNDRYEPLSVNAVKGRPRENSYDDCIQTRSFKAQGMMCDLELIIDRVFLLDEENLGRADLFYSVGLIYESPWKYALVGFDISGERAYLARAFELDISGAKDIDERTESMYEQIELYLSENQRPFRAKLCVDMLINEFLSIKYSSIVED